MVVDGGLRIRARVVVPHPGLRTSDEGSVAEDHPRFFDPGGERSPKRSQRPGGPRYTRRRHRGFGESPVPQQASQNDQRSDEAGQQQNEGNPPACRHGFNHGARRRHLARRHGLHLRLDRSRFEGKVIASFRNFDQDGIRRSLSGVVLRQLHPQTSGLHADGGVRLRVKVRGPPEHLGGNLILLHRGVGMIEGLFCEILQQLAEGLGAPQTMTFNNVIYLLEELFGRGGESVCHSHLTLM